MTTSSNGPGSTVSIFTASVAPVRTIVAAPGPAGAGVPPHAPHPQWLPSVPQPQLHAAALPTPNPSDAFSSTVPSLISINPACAPGATMIIVPAPYFASSPLVPLP